MPEDEDEYITVEEAAQVLGVTSRQVNRYGGGDTPRLRTERAGRRILYNREDVNALADELGAHRRLSPPPPPPTNAELMPAGQVLDYLRERDDQLREMQNEIQRLATENGAVRAQLAMITAERDQIRAQIAATKKRPFWRFWTND